MTWLEWYWPIMLFVVLPGLIFAIPEWLALKTGGETFSSFMRVTSDHPFWGKLFVLAWGILIGGLFVHFNGWCVAPA